MDEERLRELLRFQQERGNSHNFLQQYNQGLGPSHSNLTALMLARAGSPAEAPAASATVLDQLFASQQPRRSSFLSDAVVPSSSINAVTRNELSSLAISQEIKRLEELQRQLTSTSTSIGHPFLHSSRLGLTPTATGDRSSLLQQYLLFQKPQAPNSIEAATSGIGAALTSNPNLTVFLNERPSQPSPLELQEARLLAQSQTSHHRDTTTFGAAAMAKAPAPFPEIPTNSPYVGSGGRKMRGGVIEPFPEKLHRMLTEVAMAGRSDIISWVSNSAFAIHKSNEFFETIVPLYFKQSRLSSFKRQLNLYGFELIPNGPSRGCYHHPLFQKDHPDLCRRMRRVAVKVSAAKTCSNADSDKEGESIGSEDEHSERKATSLSGSQKSEPDE